MLNCLQLLKHPKAYRISTDFLCESLWYDGNNQIPKKMYIRLFNHIYVNVFCMMKITKSEYVYTTFQPYFIWIYLVWWKQPNLNMYIRLFNHILYEPILYDENNQIWIYIYDFSVIFYMTLFGMMEITKSEYVYTTFQPYFIWIYLVWWR